MKSMKGNMLDILKTNLLQDLLRKAFVSDSVPVDDIIDKIKTEKTHFKGLSFGMSGRANAKEDKPRKKNKKKDHRKSKKQTKDTDVRSGSDSNQDSNSEQDQE